MKIILLFLLLATARADLPVSGRPVPALSTFDNIMQQEMAAGGATAGVLGVMRNGRIIYLRGFGYLDDGSTPLPENALLRTASCTKPLTAAAIRQLAASGALGALGLQRRVFNLTVDGTNNDGLLNVTPFLIAGVNQLGDDRYADITVAHLLRHAGGFNRRASPGDPMFKSRDIAEQMGVASPPSRHNIMRWMLGRPLFWAPGTVDVNTNGLDENTEDPYSNFGYMVLGEIVAAYSPQGGYMQHLHNQVLTPDMWVPTGELLQGRTLPLNRNAREPLYTGGSSGQSVFDSFPFVVPEPYGRWDMDNMLAHGGIIVSAASMLEFGSRYEVWYPNVGTARSATSASGGSHTGALTGTSSVIWPRGDADGLVIYAAFNHRKDDGNSNADEIAPLVRGRIANTLGLSLSWPTVTCDGFWVSAGSGTGGTVGRGGYHDPYRGFEKAWAQTTAGSRIRLKPGNNAWSGVLNRRMRLDAPEGAARIGAQ